MKKILIIQEILPHYRVPLFNRVGQESNIELTVAYNESYQFNDNQIRNFKTITFSKKRIGQFFKIQRLRKIIKQFDEIIIMADLHWLPIFIEALLFKGKSKIYFWGIGLSSEQGLKRKSFADKLRFFLSDISSGTFLYSSKIAEYYIQNVRKKDQIYIANNTIEVEKFPFPSEPRTKILSIGSFKKYKNLANLIIAFSQIIGSLEKNITLDFIGDGEEEEKLKELVNLYQLNDRVIFWGRKENDREIYPIISKAIVCVSPTQAGLAVLHAMAFGCPYLTSKDAVTGGERFYIRDNINSYLYEGSIEQLAEKILWIVNHQAENLDVAKNAYDFYHDTCNIENLANSFINVVGKRNYQLNTFR